MSSAGQQLVAGRIPGELIGTPTVVTANSPAFVDTDTELMSIEVPLVIGRTYQVWWIARFNSTIANDDVLCRIREDDVNGVDIQRGQLALPFNTTVGHGPVFLVGLYEATATANKTFAGVADRNSGTGDLNLNAAATAPSIMWVTYFSG